MPLRLIPFPEPSETPTPGIIEVPYPGAEPRLVQGPRRPNNKKFVRRTINGPTGPTTSVEVMRDDWATWGPSHPPVQHNKPAMKPVEEKKEEPAPASAYKTAGVQTSLVGAVAEPKKDEKPTDNSKDEKKDEKKGDETTFTAEQDAKLKELKAENKSWKQIADALGMKPNEIPKLRARFKELEGKPAGAETKATERKDEKPAEKKDEKPAQETKANNGKKVQHNTTNNGNNQAGGNNGNNGNVTTKPKYVKPGRTPDGHLIVQEDEVFDAQELHLLIRLIKHDDEEKWLRIASRFFDRTGRRKEPDGIRERFEEWC